MQDPTPEEVAQVLASLQDEIPFSGRGSVVQVRTKSLPIEEEEDRIRSAVENSVGNHALITGGSLGSAMIPIQELQELLTKHVSESPNEEPVHSPKWELLQRLKEKQEEQTRDLRTASEKPVASPPEWQEILPPIETTKDVVNDVFSGGGPCPEEGPTGLGEPDWVGEFLDDNPYASDPKVQELTVLWSTPQNGYLPMEFPEDQTREYKPANTNFLVTGKDTDLPPTVSKSFPLIVEGDGQRKEGRVGTIQEFAQMRQEREKKGSEGRQLFELIEYPHSGKTFYIASFVTQQQLNLASFVTQQLNPKEHPEHAKWVEGPVWAAIHKMTGWSKEKIQMLDVRVRMVPPL